MKTAILIASAILFWQNIHATPSSTVSGSNKVLSSKVSQIAEYNETAVEEVLADPRCPADLLMDTAKCTCFMASLEGTLTTNADTLCREAFGEDPSELDACSSFTNDGVLNKEKATMNVQKVTEECLSGRFDENSFVTAAVRMYSMRYHSVRLSFLGTLVLVIAILVVTARTLNDYTPMPPFPPTPTPSPAPSDAIRMLTQEFVRNFSPKTAKLLAYNS